MDSVMRIDRKWLALYKAAVEGKPEDYYTALGQQSAVAVEDNGLPIQVMPNGNTVLHVAVLHGHENFVDTILQGIDNGAALSLLFAQNKENESVLHFAAEKGYAKIVSILISATEDVESGTGATRRMIQMTDNLMDTALHKAVRMGHLAVVKLLVEKDVEFVYPPNIVGETPIYIAAKLGFCDCLQQLLETCNYPNYGGPLGQNALHAIVFSSPGMVSKFIHGHDGGTTGCTKLLLKKEISLCEMTDDSGWTPLHYAIKMGDNKTARTILAENSSAAYICAGKGDEWATVFHIAARYGNVEMMKYISNSFPDCWMMLNSKCRNVLHEAVLGHKLNVIEYVLKYTQSDNLIEGKDKDGNTPLDLLPNFFFNPLIRVAMQGLMWTHLAFNKQHQTPLGWNVIIGKGGKTGRQGDLPKKPKQRKDDVDIDKYIDFMVKTSQTKIIVASLILSVTFTAGLTVPGGYNSNPGETQGTPILLHDVFFKGFVFLDCLAFIFSILSVVCHTVMIAEASSSTKNYELINKYFKWNNLAITMAAASALAAFTSGILATLNFNLSFFLGFSVLFLHYCGSIGILWLSITSFRFDDSGIVLLRIDSSTIKKLVFRIISLHLALIIWIIYNRYRV